MEPTPRWLLALGLLVTLIQCKATTQEEGGCPDEEEEEILDCGPHATKKGCFCKCVKGFQSIKWPKGFKKADENDCSDIDECKNNASICGPNGTCINIIGDYHCKCKEGFVKSQKDDRKLCTRDIDECYTQKPCDKTAICINLKGSYQCECKRGYFPYVTHDGKNTTKCKEISCPVVSEEDCSGEQMFLCKFRRRLENLCQSSLNKTESASPKKHLKDILALLDEGVTPLKAENPTQRHSMATKMMEEMEAFLRVLPFALNSGFSTGPSNGTELTLEIRTDRNQSQTSVQLRQSENQMELNWDAASKGDGFSFIGLLTYHGLESVLTEAPVDGKVWKQIGKSPQWAQVAGKPTYKVLSKVAAVVVDRNETTSLSTPVTVTFCHQEPDVKSDLKVICAFWEPVGDSGRWSEKGCKRLNTSTDTKTHCQCDHLTSFAVLMAFYDVEAWELTVITKVGLVVSLVCLFLSILTFLFCRAIRGIRTTIHLHLCLTLFAADVIFLLGAGNSSNETACAVVAGMLHYVFLSVFCWMLLEGLELYLMVVQVFKTHTLKHWHLYLVGYGLPAILVGLSAAINSKGYGNKNCWLSRERGFLWSFLGPVSLIIMVNAIVFVITVWKLSQKFVDINPDMSTLKKQRVLTITAIAQLCILGTTWIFGMFQFSNSTLLMSYIFTILNSLQGLFIFVLHCLLKKQVRDEYSHWFCRSRHGKGHSTDKSSDFSSTSASNTLRAQKSFRESGI